jgi:hypothetical protein
MGAQVPFPQRVRERFIPNPKLPLYEQCHEAMRFKQLALRSEDAYLQWIKRFIVFHRREREPESKSLGSTESRPTMRSPLDG